MSDFYKLLKAVERSEAAYTIYRNEQKYFQAKRIYAANKQVYSILENLLVNESQQNWKEELRNYIFHLDDWFLQFEEHAKNITPDLGDKFVFDRVKGMLAHPSDFISKLKQIEKQ